MFEKKYNWRAKFFVGLFVFMIAIAFLGIWIGLSNEILDENGEPLGIFLSILLVSLFGFVALVYAIALVSYLKQLINHKMAAFSVDENGIHNIAWAINILAFFVIIKVNLIPWEGVKHVVVDDETTYIRVKRSCVKAGFLGKLIVGVLGFSFQPDMISEGLSKEEKDIIKAYCVEKSLCLEQE